MADEVTTLRRRVDFLESSIKSINVKFNLLVNFVNNKLDLSSKAQDEQNKLFSNFYKNFVDLSSSVPEPHSEEETETGTVKLNGHPLANVTVNYSEEEVHEKEQSVFFNESQDGQPESINVDSNVKNEFETDQEDVIFEVVGHNSPSPQNRVQEESFLGMSSTIKDQIIPEPVANLPYKNLNRSNLRRALQRVGHPLPGPSGMPQRVNVQRAQIARIPKPGSVELNQNLKQRRRVVPSRQLSSCWEHFTKILVGKEVFCKCHHCGKDLSPRADHLSSHLLRKHNIYLANSKMKIMRAAPLEN